MRIGMKVLVNNACWLSNKMFQYSFYLFLKNKGYDVTVDFYNSVKNVHVNVDRSGTFTCAEFK